MAHFIPATFIATAAAAFAVIANAPDHDTVRTPEFQIEALIEDSKTWVLENSETNTACLITKTKRVTRGTSIIESDPSCLNVIADSASFQVWQESDEGVITLANDRGQPMANFIREADDITFLSKKLRLTPNS